jgi:hypothetical protein
VIYNNSQYENNEKENTVEKRKSYPRKFPNKLKAALIAAVSVVLAAIITAIPIGENQRPLGCSINVTIIQGIAACQSTIQIINNNSTETPSEQITPERPVAEDCNSSISSLGILSPYDNFNHASYNRSFNQLLWSRGGSEESYDIYQENGKLIFEVLNIPTDDEGSWFVPHASGVNLSEVNTIQADFSWEQESTGLLYLGITISSNPWSEILSYTCDFLIRQNSAVYICRDWTESEEHRTQDYSVITGQSYTLLIEFSPATHTYYSYLNEQLIDTYELVDLSQETFTYDIHLGAIAGSSGKAYVDNVCFGTPK